LAGVEPQYSDLIIHTEIPYVNTGKSVSRFLELIPQEQGLLESRSEKYKQLTDAFDSFSILQRL
jgi:hypothetical protein